MFFRHGRSRAPWRHHHPSRGHGPRSAGRGLGMRRPLRFLAERLELDEHQMAELSKVLENLRLEREQADLDRRKAQAKIADLLEGDSLDEAALTEAAAGRVQAAERERNAAIVAVQRLHALLQPVQRTKLATLVRGGPFAL